MTRQERADELLREALPFIGTVTGAELYVTWPSNFAFIQEVLK